MKRIAFFTNQICGRGTTDIVLNYAKYNQTLLNNQSIIITMTDRALLGKASHNQIVFANTKKQFEVIELDSTSDLQKLADMFDVFYACKTGDVDDVMMYGPKTLIHAVFPFTCVHGDEYFYISEYCSKLTHHNKWLEPIIDDSLFHTENWRTRHNLNSGDIVFGRTGGYDSFDIPFVKSSIIKMVNQHPNMHFWFVNTERFYDHQNIKHFDFLSKHDLVSFMNTCDAMIHARKDGECFGISIAEFSMCNKPIITHNKSHWSAHLTYLKQYHGYNDECDLENILTSFVPDPSGDYNFYKQFSPQNIMSKFQTLL